MNIRTALVVVSCALSVIIGLVVARGGAGGNARAGAGGVGAKQRPLIGLSLDTLKEARWQADKDLFVARCNALGADVKVTEANSDDTRQMSDVNGLITSGVDVLVIVPHNGTAMAAAVRAANQANIPVIAYDRLIRDSDLDLYISFDNVRVGELQAQYLVDKLPKGRIVRIYGSKTDNNAFQFKQGQDNVLKPYIDRGDIKVVHEDWAEDWKPENGKRIAQAALTGHPQGFDAILASNDGVAGGAIQALSEEKIAGKVLVTGQDAELVACQRIVAGTQAMTVYKPLKMLANRAAEVAVQMANGKAIIANTSVNNGTADVPTIAEKIMSTTKDNMIDTVIKDGFHPYEAVYSAVPADQRPPKP
jgi:D-xylose transport system substrate-binding protein